MTTIDFNDATIDLHMTGYAEGKHDDIRPSTHAVTKKKSTANPRVKRRKAGIFKARKRMLQLEVSDDGVPQKKPISVTRGMLRSHQLPMQGTSCKFHISDKRRQDAAHLKLAELT